MERKDGMPKRPKKVNYDKVINMKISSELEEKIKQVATELGISYQPFIRNVMNDYCERYYDNKKRENELREHYMKINVDN